jgi:hypothetical protein
MASGILTPMPVIISQFIGGLIGHFIKARIGEDKWLRYRPLIVTGFILGDGSVLTFTVTITLISKAQWVLPF